MEEIKLPRDPYNVIITGVGGQGNVLASKVLGNALVNKGLDVTVGETFGATQRGGSVMSHLRISAQSSWSPQIPKGMAHIVIALEPVEALRVLSVYGNPETLVITNDRPVYPVGVICGEMDYPEQADLRQVAYDLQPGLVYSSCHRRSGQAWRPYPGEYHPVGRPGRNACVAV